MTNTKEKGDSTVGSVLKERIEECTLSPVSFELELGRVREESRYLAVAVNRYGLGMKKLDKKLDGEEPNGTALLH